MLKILLGSSRPINLDYLGLRAGLTTLILVTQRERLLVYSSPGLRLTFATFWRVNKLDYRARITPLPKNTTW